MYELFLILILFISTNATESIKEEEKNSFTIVVSSEKSNSEESNFKVIIKGDLTKHSEEEEPSGKYWDKLTPQIVGRLERRVTKFLKDSSIKKSEALSKIKKYIRDIEFLRGISGDKDRLLVRRLDILNIFLSTHLNKIINSDTTA